jgi:lysyl-tRNA synthetase class 2
VAGPAWLINTPLFISPLAKTNLENPDTVQRFQAVIAGSELCNGYSELNDPIDQLNRFLEQEAMRASGDAEAQMLDIDYVEMLEYGMPPTCGLGFSERVFWIFEGVSAREGVPFPQMRHEIDDVTKSIYPELKF